jgi:hypothetical protein
MQQVAQGLASLGRGNDKMLVHMTPGEVKGLQSLAMAHGGSLTINPHTGLPEAGFLSSMLPTVLGIGATVLSGGAITPLMAGLGIGGLAALTTGSLGKGLMAGLGAFGGAGLGGTLSEFGNISGVEAAKKAAIDKSVEEGMRAATVEGLPLEANFYNDLVAKTTATPLSAPVSADSTVSERMANFGRGIPAAIQNPAAVSSAVTNNLNQYGKYGSIAAAAPLALEATKALAQQPTLAPGTVPTGTPAMIRPYTYRSGAVNKNYATDVASAGYSKNPYFLDQGYTEQTPYRAAAGGQVPQPSVPLDLSQNYPGSNITKSSYATLPSTDSQEVVDGYGPKINPFTGAEGMAGGGVVSRLIEQMKINKQGPFADPREEAMQYQYNPDDQQYTEMAAGGIASLPEYAAGGKLLRGPGDGMSDDIPAVIKGAKQQRAALADGEFVIPADVVSHLGNGSTDAGAKRLYSMMDKVRQARTGNKKQGRQINAEKYIPA